MPIPFDPPPVSGGLTLEEMRDYIRNASDANTDEVSDGEIDDAINASYFDLVGDDPWPSLLNRATVSLTSGIDEYDIPSAISTDCEGHRIQAVTSGNVSLIQMTPKQFFQVQPLGSTPRTGSATHYILIGDTLAFWPEPSSNTSAQVVYYALPPKLTDDSDKPVFPARYHELVQMGGLARTFERIDDYEVAANIWGHWQARRASMREDLLRAQPSGDMLLLGEPIGYPTFSTPGGLRFPWE